MVIYSRSLCLLLAMLTVVNADGLSAGKRKPAKRKPALQKVVRIAEETTRVTKPLDKAGYVDYVAALNQEKSAGATLENNFEVVLREVCGWPALAAESRPKYYQMLGMTEPLENPRTLIPYDEFVQDQKALEQWTRSTDAAWTAKDCPEVARYLTAMQPSLQRLIEATERTQFYTPYLCDPKVDEPLLVHVQSPSGSQLRKVAITLRSAAMYDLGREDVRNTVDKIVALHRIAGLSAHGPHLIDYLVAIAIDAQATDVETALLQSALLNAEATADLERKLKQLGELPDARTYLDRGERHMALDATISIIRATQSKKNPKALEGPFGVLLPLMNHTIDWNGALLQINDEFDQILEVLDAPTEQRRDRGEEADGQLKRRLGKMTAVYIGQRLLGTDSPEERGRVLGEYLCRLLLPGLHTARSVCRHQARRSVVQGAIGLHKYYLENRRYPRSLSHLVPKYLESLPKDPGTGKELVYYLSDEECCIYSVGYNGEDEREKRDLQKPKDQQQGDDVVITLPVK